MGRMKGHVPVRVPPLAGSCVFLARGRDSGARTRECRGAGRRVCASGVVTLRRVSANGGLNRG